MNNQSIISQLVLGDVILQSTPTLIEVIVNGGQNDIPSYVFQRESDFRMGIVTRIEKGEVNSYLAITRPVVDPMTLFSVEINLGSNFDSNELALMGSIVKLREFIGLRNMPYAFTSLNGNFGPNANNNHNGW